MILWGKKADAIVARVVELEAQVKERDERLNSVEREIVRIITDIKEKENDTSPVISKADEEGEVWLRSKAKR